MIYTWDSEKRVYLDSDGNEVSEDELRRWVDDALAVLALAFIERADRFRGNITVENFQKWNTETRNDLYSLHYAMAALAFGGATNVAFDLWQYAETEIQNQLRFWDNFAVGVVAGIIALDGVFPVRTSLYALAGYQTFQNALMQREMAAGMDEYKNNLGASDHCVDCLTETAKGFVAIGSLTPIGTRLCKVRCRCWYSFRKRPQTTV